MINTRPLEDFLIKVGVISSIIVVLFWLLGNFIVPVTALECLNVRTGEIGLAARGRGNTVIYDVVGPLGTIHYRSTPSQFTCEAIYGKDWAFVGPR